MKHHPCHGRHHGGAAAGYSDADFSGAWPSGQMTLYRNLDLDEGIAIGPDDNMTRQDAMRLFYNLLTTPT